MMPLWLVPPSVSYGKCYHGQTAKPNVPCHRPWQGRCVRAWQQVATQSEPAAMSRVCWTAPGAQGNISPESSSGNVWCFRWCVCDTIPDFSLCLWDWQGRLSCSRSMLCQYGAATFFSAQTGKAGSSGAMFPALPRRQTSSPRHSPPLRGRHRIPVRKLCHLRESAPPPLLARR